MKPVATSICLAIAFLIPAAADAQWGAALGAGVDQMNRQRDLGLQRQQSELMQQQLESQMRIQEIEQRRYQMELEERKREREAINAEIERRNKMDRIQALFSKTINEYGDAGKEAVRATMEILNGKIDKYSHKEIEQTLSVELIEPMAKADRMRKNNENIARFMADYPQYKKQKKKDLLGKSMDLVMADFNAGIGPGYADMYELLVLSHKRLLKSMPQGRKKQL